MTATVWHNPGCGSSKNAIAYLQEKGITPVIYLYVEEKPSRADIADVLRRLGVTASDLLRPNEAAAAALGLYDGASEDAILDAMAENAALVQRPIVITERGAVIARPKSRIDEVL